MRRTPGATGSSLPYSKANSRRYGISTAMPVRPQWLCHSDFGYVLPFLAGVVEQTSPRSRPMKIHLDLDCTPDELRGFFGLPDVRPMQEKLLKDVEERLRANVKALDPEAM